MTGLGCVSPLGLTWTDTWAGLRAGRSGIALLGSLDVADLPSRIGGEVRGLDLVAALGGRQARHLDRFAALAVVAAREAAAQAGLDSVPRDRLGVVVGSGLGGLGSFEEGTRTLAARGPARVSPYLSPAVIPNAAAAAVGMDAGALGPSLCPVTACATGTDAIGLAADMLRLGRADAVLAGGADAPLTRTLLAAFAAARAVSRRNDDPEGASRPFGADRDGFVVAEGAAVLVLETLEGALARGAVPLAEVTGWGSASDAHHITAPRPDGARAEAAVRIALAEAGIGAGALGWINAHGTSTPEGDAVEARVLTRVLDGAAVPVGATKSMTGHLLGAAGALEAAACVQALVDRVLPPTRNAHRPDAGINLDLVAEGERPAPGLEHVLSTSFGFGGHDSALVLRRV